MDTSRISTPAVALSRDLRTALRRARDLGIRGVELDARGGLHPEQVSRTGLRQLRKWLGDEGVEVSAIAFRTRGGYADSDRLEGRIAATKKALDVAHGLGAGLVLNHVGEIPPESVGPQWRLLVDVLSDIGAWSVRAGATLCVEAGRAAPADLRRLAAALPEGTIACDLVTGSLVVHAHDPVSAVADLAGLVGMVHLTDAVAGAFAGRGRAVELGTGQVDVAGVLAALDERDYQGWIGIEPLEDRTAAAELRAALEFLRSL
jgi:sugar phosphate isomerase/epimerase